MGSLTDYAENAFLNHITTNAAYTPAATIYLALATADPTDAATGASMNEVANSGAYARTAITFGAAASRVITQNADVVFPEATGSWGTVTHWAIVDTNTYGSGNVLAHGAFGSSFAPVTGNIWTVASAEINVTFSAGSTVGFTNYTANGFLDRMFRNQAFTVSATYASLHTATSSDSTPGTESAGANYARKEIAENGGVSPTWTTVSGGAVSNNNDVSFGAPSGSWGTIVSMGIYDAATVGNQLAYGNDVVDQAVDATATDVLFVAGDLDMSIT